MKKNLILLSAFLACCALTSHAQNNQSVKLAQLTADMWDYNYRWNDNRGNTRRDTPRREQREYRDPYDDEYYEDDEYLGSSGDYYQDEGDNRYQYGYRSNQLDMRQKKASVRYSEKLCDSGKYDCIKIKRGDRWSTLFPDKHQRDLVKRFNRINVKLTISSRIAVPPNIEKTNLIAIAPFDKHLDTNGKKLIIINLPKQAWVAYGNDGNIVKWGPASGGQNWCHDIGKPCKTIRGAFAVFNKKGPGCQSKSFPVDRGGGAPMPYCMFFHSGYAIHGSNDVPGFNMSHGCVRVYTQDAKWLNEEFVDMPQFEGDKGTEVIVQTDTSLTPNTEIASSNSIGEQTQKSEFTPVDDSNDEDPIEFEVEYYEE